MGYENVLIYIDYYIKKNIYNVWWKKISFKHLRNFAKWYMYMLITYLHLFIQPASIRCLLKYVLGLTRIDAWKKLVFKCMHTCKSQVRLVLQRFFTVSLFQEIIKNKNDLLKNGTIWNFKHTFFRWLCVFKGSLEWMLASLLFFYRLWWNGRYAMWWIGFLIFKTWS